MGNRDEVSAWLERSLALLPMTQHFIHQRRADIDRRHRGRAGDVLQPDAAARRDVDQCVWRLLPPPAGAYRKRWLAQLREATCGSTTRQATGLWFEATRAIEPQCRHPATGNPVKIA